MGKEPDAVTALRLAADFLIPAMKLKNFSEPALRDAFKLLHSSNPHLVEWVFKDLAAIVKETF